MGLSLRRRAHSPGPSYVLPRCHPSFRHPRDDGDEDKLEAKWGWVIYPPPPASPEPPPSVEGALGPIAFLQPPRDQNRPALRPGGRGGPAAVAAPRQPFGSAAGSGGLAGCHVGHGICLPRLLRCPPIFEHQEREATRATGHQNARTAERHPTSIISARGGLDALPRSQMPSSHGPRDAPDAVLSSAARKTRQRQQSSRRVSGDEKTRQRQCSRNSRVVAIPQSQQRLNK